MHLLKYLISNHQLIRRGIDFNRTGVAKYEWVNSQAVGQCSIFDRMVYNEPK